MPYSPEQRHTTSCSTRDVGHRLLRGERARRVLSQSQPRKVTSSSPDRRTKGRTRYRDVVSVATESLSKLNCSWASGAPTTKAEEVNPLRTFIKNRIIGQQPHLRHKCGQAYQECHRDSAMEGPILGILRVIGTIPCKSRHWIG